VVAQTDDLSELDRAPASAKGTTATKPKAKTPANKGTVKDDPDDKTARDRTREPKERKDKDDDSLDPLSKLLPPLSSADADGDGKRDDIERPDDIDGEASVVATNDGGGAGLTGAKALAALSVLALVSTGGFAWWRKRQNEPDLWD
jgi:hypothetical protein